MEVKRECLHRGDEILKVKRKTSVWLSRRLAETDYRVNRIRTHYRRTIVTMIVVQILITSQEEWSHDFE